MRISNRGIADKTKTTFRVTFFDEGEFDFCCRIYTWMKGQVKVEYCAKAAKSQAEDEFEKPGHKSSFQDEYSSLVKAAINCDKTNQSQKMPGVVDFKSVFGQLNDN